MKVRAVFFILQLVLSMYSVRGYSYTDSIEKNNISEKKFVIVVPSYNNVDWYKRNLDSIFIQKYSNYRVIYIDDVSSDGTGDLVESYINKNNLHSKVTLIKNIHCGGPLSNHYKASLLCKPEEIIVNLDGDDWFANENVLSRLNQEYEDPDVWLTYGQFAFYYGDNRPLGKGLSSKIPYHVLVANSIRKDGEGSTPSHLRSFYAGLFHKIKKEDLMYEGKFFSMAGDVAMLLPMIEMAGIHTRFIPDLLYIYNRATSLNEDKINPYLQINTDHLIRSRKIYEHIENLDTLFNKHGI
jgi:glycosyltransferase involved in cell wall biosynthesis